MTIPFLFASEMELHTVCHGVHDPEQISRNLSRLLETLRSLVPALSGPSGIFCPYGRIYIDINQHLEIALCECDSPYVLATVLEQLQLLLRKAVRRLQASAGGRISLGNNNHSGLLVPGIRETWGHHENHLVDKHPSQLPGELLLPFLVTRVYQGAGAIEFPSGNFLAGSRARCMNLAVGGSTHEHGSRAIHSTCRDEHHMGPRSRRYRYHLILADGLRSQFNTAVLYGASSLAFQAALHDRQLRRSLPRFDANDWVETLHRLNRLATPGQPPRVDPLVIHTQRAYLEASRRYAESQGRVPRWVPRVLGDWSDTLDAMEQDDGRGWLAARLDPFIKYEFFSSVLRHRGKSWADVPNNRSLCTELELLNCSYHEFTDPKSYFTRLDEAGALRQRVAPPLEPGTEPEPYVPETSTRAKARARFIVEHRHERDLLMDWGEVFQSGQHRRKTLYDPFAKSYSRWKEGGSSPHDVDRLLDVLRRIRESVDTGF